MITVFDVFGLTLLAASLTLFVTRFVTQDPPVYPYLIIALTCLVMNWLGEAGGGIAALGLMVAASFSFLGCLLYPKWRHMGQSQAEAEGNATNGEQAAG